MRRVRQVSPAENRRIQQLLLAASLVVLVVSLGSLLLTVPRLQGAPGPRSRDSAAKAAIAGTPRSASATPPPSFTAPLGELLLEEAAKGLAGSLQTELQGIGDSGPYTRFGVVAAIENDNGSPVLVLDAAQLLPAGEGPGGSGSALTLFDGADEGLRIPVSKDAVVSLASAATGQPVPFDVWEAGVELGIERVPVAVWVDIDGGVAVELTEQPLP